MVAVLEDTQAATPEQKIHFEQRRKAERLLSEDQALALERLETEGWKFLSENGAVWSAEAPFDWLGLFDSLADAIAGAEQQRNGDPAKAPSEFKEILLDDITVSPFQMRKNFDETLLEELADSIRQKGVLEPILVRETFKINKKGKSYVYELVAGERRFRAAKLAGLTTIPAIVRHLSDKAAAEVGAVENCQRKDLDPIEEAEGYDFLMKNFGYTADMLATKIHKSKAHVYAILKLCRLPKAAREALIAGKIPASTAQIIGRIPNEKLREKAAEEIANPQWGDPLSFRMAKLKIEQSYMKELKGVPFLLTDAGLLPAAGACSVCPKLTGNNRDEYPDGRADVCTDPGCLAKKISAFEQRSVTTLKDKGFEVLKKADAKKVFNWDNQVRSDSGYFDLADQCGLDPKKRSYKQLLGEGLTRYAAIDEKRRPHYLVKQADAIPVLKEKHNLDLKVQKPSSSSSTYDYRAEEAKRKREEAITEKVTAEIFAAISSEIRAGMKLVEVLRWLVNQRLWHQSRDALVRLGLQTAQAVQKLKPEAARKILVAHIGTMELWPLIALLVEEEFNSEGIDYRGNLEPHGMELLKLFDVDWKAKRKEAAALVAAAEKATEKKGTATKKSSARAKK